MRIEEYVLLAPYTYFKVGGPARYFIRAKTKEEFENALLFASQKQLPFFILGSGSNVLVADKGFEGVVIKMELTEVTATGNHVYAGAGVPMAKVTWYASEHGLTGFEWGVGVPGTVGGSVRGNAGCFGSAIADVLESATVYTVTTKQIEIMKSKDCHFNYRHSVFKERPNFIILGATFLLAPAQKEKIVALIKEYTSRRLATQDIGSKSAGCVFKNPSDGVFAGQLIESAGLKGKSIGGAMVSEKHGNFFINKGNATAEDVRQLIEKVRDYVKAKHGVVLENEIQYVGFYS